MAIRKVLVTVVGHVDHGKTSLLDRIRSSIVTAGEVGGITQAIGVSIIPIDTIKKICGKLMNVFQNNLTVPGLLTIDTPGHAAFTSLRKRGGSLADIAILVVDINEGFKPQTLESIEILKAHKVPFIVAANKIDLLTGWSYDESKFLIDNINQLDYKAQGVFEGKMYELVAKFQELGLDAERFDRVGDYTKQIALVPLSAKTGQGIPELLLVITALAQKYLEKKLAIEEDSYAKGTILEVKEEKGLGTTIDTIIYNGKLKVNDTIIIGSIDQPIIAKVRALLEPLALADMRDKKGKFQNVKEVYAATGVKIAAPGLETAIAGMPLRACSGKIEEINLLKQEVQQEVKEVVSEDNAEIGVLIKADTIGGLEALRHLLRERQIPISSASLGEVSKRDIAQLEMMKEKEEFYGVILGFNTKIPADITEVIKNKQLKVITNEIIYKTIEEYELFRDSLKKEIELRELNNLVRPCKFLILKGYVFRQNNPAVVGVEIEIGKIRSTNPIMNAEGKHLTTVKAMEENKESINVADQGKQIAMSMDNVTVGRQIHEGDFLYTDIPEEHFKKLKELKRHLTKNEIEVLKEILEIKRKDNPVWGVG
ncbi:MAG: translation initiation factor IF-2 [Candidatus Buchananbacteria bacterium RIFCSPHIGHO2_02_FULL_39_17]|nr:MAG: translation initiation factor IF-2 [Candidatus Buchananbacteria bacterium RIFCSPHIGHO2_02_FULL_39_17]